MKYIKIKYIIKTKTIINNIIIKTINKKIKKQK